MHDDHEHHHHHHGNDHAHFPHALPGDNHRPAQWQVPHLDGAEHPIPDAERDLDLVETAFVEGFGRTTDPTSFLRLAGIPFVGIDGEGRRLHLLRVETESLTDIGAVAPLLGGEGVRYDPLPARMVSQRRRLAFVYHDGCALERLEFAEARRLADDSAATRFPVEAHA